MQAERILTLSIHQPGPFIYEEATKGAFTEITDELLSKYMPQTTEGQDSMAFEQAKINGKCYMIPKNSLM